MISQETLKMDHILSKEIDRDNLRALDNLRYNNFENTHSEEEDEFEEVSAKNTGNSEMDFDLSTDSQFGIKSEIKEEILDLGVDIIMPEASSQSTTGGSNNQQVTKPKKDVRSKKEMEEEEREKMQ